MKNKSVPIEIRRRVEREAGEHIDKIVAAMVSARGDDWSKALGMREHLRRIVAQYCEGGEAGAAWDKPAGLGASGPVDVVGLGVAGPDRIGGVHGFAPRMIELPLFQPPRYFGDEIFY